MPRSPCPRCAARRHEPQRHPLCQAGQRAWYSPRSSAGGAGKAKIKKEAMATSRVSIPGTAAMPEGGLCWVGGWNSSPLLNSFNSWNRPSREEMVCLADERPSTELAEARAYLVQTASLTYTTAQQGPEVAIERLPPKFADSP